MALLATVTNGQVAVPAQYNGLVNAFNNVLGVTDDGQTNVGKLGLPYVTSNPGSPVNGELWIRSDESRLYGRIGGANIPFRSARQIVEAAQGQNVAFGPTASFSDITSLSVSITVTANSKLLIGHIAGGWTDDGTLTQMFVGDGSGPAGSGVFPGMEMRPVIGAVTLQAIRRSTSLAIAGASPSLLLGIEPFGFQWFYTHLGAGTYTVKLQVRYNVAFSVVSPLIINTRLIVMEI